MAKANATPAERLKELDAVLGRIDKMEKRGNWVEDRKEILKGLTIDDIEAMAERIRAENPDRYSTPEEIRALVKQMEEAEPATRRAELVSA